MFVQPRQLTNGFHIEVIVRFIVMPQTSGFVFDSIDIAHGELQAAESSAEYLHNFC